LIRTIPAQLTDIYEQEEDWHLIRMSTEDAYKYHKKRYDRGNIQVYQKDDMVLGYYERYIVGNICYLYNVWIKKGCRRGEVFKDLYKRFFNTMPREVDRVIGRRHKFGDRIQTALISEWRRSQYGYDKGRTTEYCSGYTYG